MGFNIRLMNILVGLFTNGFTLMYILTVERY